MTEEEAFAALGRKQVDFERLDIEYTKLFNLLSQVMLGEILPERVTLDFTDRSWKVEPVVEATKED